MRVFSFWLGVLFFLCHAAIGQNETSQWYFGWHAGLNFLNNPPTSQPVSKITAWEGAASVADASGNLLFYTSGDTIWNRLHQTMANGAGLFGHKSSAQHLVVKQPGVSSIYYVFTTDQPFLSTSLGFCYSTVDMNLAAGNGSVVIKNTMLVNWTSEQLTAVKHCNGRDIWIVVHEWNTNVFRSYLLSPSGLSPAITSAIGPTLSTQANGFLPGVMKISPTGRKLAMALAQSSKCDYGLFDFDNVAGIVSNYLFLQTGANGYLSRGSEFSPDGSKFYGIADFHLYQWDLCAGTSSQVVSSKDSIAAIANAILQLAPNGKIYFVNEQPTDTIGEITQPNLSIPACNYVPNSFTLTSGLCQSLPNFVTSYFRAPMPSFAYTANCGTVNFTSPPPSLCSAQSRSISGYQWLFGDPQSGTANTSTLVNASHTYLAPGAYTVNLVLQYGCGNDTVKQVVNVNSVPAIGVAGNFTICFGEQHTYTASGANSYSWNGVSGPSTRTLAPTSIAVYTVTGVNGSGCVGGKIFTVTVKECLGLKDQAVAEVNVYLFPNPSEGLFSVHAAVDGILRVFDATGRLLVEKKFDSGKDQLDLRTYSDGIYLVEVSTIEGRKVLRLQKSVN